MQTLLDHLALIEGNADSFVTHWMEDDGNDAEDKARCEKVSDDISTASDAIKAALTAAAAMLGALESMRADLKGFNLWNYYDDASQTGLGGACAELESAIAQAKAAGLAPAEPVDPEQIKREDRIVAIAHEQCLFSEGDVTIEPGERTDAPGCLVSEGDDNGAYLRCWVWVDFSGSDLDKEKEQPATA